MIRPLGRLAVAVVQFALLLVLLTVLGSLAVTVGLVDGGLDDGEAIETPEPLPDWPILWEIGPDEDGPSDPGADGEPFEPDDSATPDAPGDPVREDPGTTSVPVEGGEADTDEIEAAIHARVNELRAERDASSLEFDAEIAGIARTYSHDMATRGYFSHQSPEGETPDDRFGDLYPGTCRAVGENLAMVPPAGAADADAVAERIVEGWMDSDGHRENLLAPRWDAQGLGVYGEGGRVYATQLFCEAR